MPAQEIQDHLLLFIQSLMLAGRHLSFYPQGHPRVENIISDVLATLDSYCHQNHPALSLSCSKKALCSAGQEIPTTQKAAADLHQLLLQHDIVEITFEKQLPRSELLNLHRFLWPPTSTEGNLKNPVQAIKGFDFKHLSIKFVDYSRLQKDHAFSPQNNAEAADIWDILLSQATQTTGNKHDLHNFLAEYMDSPVTGSGPNPQQIGLLLDRIVKARYHGGSNNDEKTLKLTQTLPEKILDTLLQSSFQALEETPEAAADIISNMSKEAIAETLRRVGQNNIKLSSRLFEILSELSKAPGQRRTTVRDTATQQPPKHNFDALFFEENLEEYVPFQYQQSLQKILTGEVSGDMPGPEATSYRQDFNRFNIERHCCETIFELLDKRVDSQTEQNIQNNLIELSDFFLETGDFEGLQNIFIQWSNYLYSGSSHVLFLEEKVLAHQTQRTFIDEVLSSILVWSTDKTAAIKQYISLLGEPYAEQLVERLAAEEDESRRHLWMEFLIELGSKAHPIILENLERGPWYLIRNLLLVLGQQNQTVPIKIILQYTKHEYPQIRKEAIRILAEKNLGIAQRLIHNELASGDPHTITEMCDLAEKNSDSRILHQLHRMLQPMPQSDKELLMKERILKALLAIGHPSSKTLMINLLEVKGLFRPRKQRAFQNTIKRTLEIFP